MVLLISDTLAQDTNPVLPRQLLPWPTQCWAPFISIHSSPAPRLLLWQPLPLASGCPLPTPLLLQMPAPLLSPLPRPLIERLPCSSPPVGAPAEQGSVATPAPTSDDGGDWSSGKHRRATEEEGLHLLWLLRHGDRDTEAVPRLAPCLAPLSSSAHPAHQDSSPPIL